MPTRTTPPPESNDVPGEEPLLGTALDHAARVPVAEPTDPAGEVLARALSGGHDSITDVAVCRDRVFVGLVRLEDLVTAHPETLLNALMDTDVPVVAPGTDQEVAAWTLVRCGERSLPVADARGTFVGLIPPERMLEVLLDHHERDLARFGGFLHDTEQARASSRERVTRRLWHRLPWLLLGLAGAMLAGRMVGTFEATLERTVALAFFMPGIVYMADAVGTQTETIVVRGLSVGVAVHDIIRREILTGLAVGVALAVPMLGFVYVTESDVAVAVTVALALLASCSIATVIAMVLPSLLHHLGVDPAFGSGPLATVVQDLLSLLIYFLIATAIVT